jgi:Flp pilus assembly protein CpaB
VKRSNRLVILVGVLLAVLAFVGVVIVLNTNPTPTATNTVPALVAIEDIPVGEPVTPEKAQIKNFPADAVVQTRLADPSQLTGRPALVDIAAGEQITQEKAGLITGGGSPQDSLKPGEKAIAFQVDRVTGLDFLIQAGDHIDIVLTSQVQVLQPTLETVDSPPGRQRFETVPGLTNARTVKTILQDRRVLYVSNTRVRATAPTASPSPGTQAAQAATAEIENVIIVFAGSDQDAEVIKFAQNDLSELGSLTAVLRRTADTTDGRKNEKTTGITIDLLFRQYGIPVPDIITQLGPKRGGR